MFENDGCHADVAAAFRDVARCGISLRTVTDRERRPHYTFGTVDRFFMVYTDHVDTDRLVFLRYLAAEGKLA